MIVVIGFSAEACIDAMYAAQWNKPGLAQRPGLIILEYDKINSGVIAYAPWNNTTPIQEKLKFYSPEAAEIEKGLYVRAELFQLFRPSHVIWNYWHNKYVPANNPVMIACKMLEFSAMTAGTGCLYATI